MKEKGFELYEKVAHILATNKTVDPRLMGLWYLIGKKILCDNIEEDSEYCNNIVEMFTSDPIALNLMTSLCQCNFVDNNVLVSYYHHMLEDDREWNCHISIDDNSGLVVKYHSSYIAVYDEGYDDGFIRLKVWNIHES